MTDENKRMISWPALKPLVFVLVPAVVVVHLFVSATGSAQPTSARVNDRSSTSSAVARFWAIFHGNDYASIPEVQAELQKAIARDPSNVTLQALLGAVHFWHAGEYTRDPNPNMTVLQQDMPTAVQLFQNALNLDYGQHPAGYVYNDHLPGFLGSNDSACWSDDRQFGAHCPGRSDAQLFRLSISGVQ
jgi:hypothetical protein